MAVNLKASTLKRVRTALDCSPPGPWEYESGYIWDAVGTVVATPGGYGRTEQENDATGRAIVELRNLSAELVAEPKRVDAKMVVK